MIQKRSDIMADVYDHLGNKFESIRKMCEYHNIGHGTYRHRLKKGLTVEQALTMTTKEVSFNETKYTDHLGNTFSNIKDMCKYHNINYQTYNTRINQGWSRERALTEPVPKSGATICKDHLDNIFYSMTDMCCHHNIPLGVYRNRIKLGWSIEKALTTPFVKKSNVCKDHISNKFKSTTAMCKHYNIDQATYAQRLEKGWSVKKALTTPTSQLCNDHLGNIFKSTKEMCRHYNIDSSTYALRIENGWALEKALTTPAGDLTICKDHLGNTFKSVSAMIKHYKISYGAYEWRIKNNWSLEKALTMITDGTVIADNYKVIRYIDDNYYECEINNERMIRHHSQILNCA